MMCKLQRIELWAIDLHLEGHYFLLIKMLHKQAILRRYVINSKILNMFGGGWTRNSIIISSEKIDYNLFIPQYPWYKSCHQVGNICSSKLQCGNLNPHWYKSFANLILPSINHIFLLKNRSQQILKGCILFLITIQ